VFQQLKRNIIALMMEAASTSETSVNFYQTARRNIPEDSHLQEEQKYKVAVKVSTDYTSPILLPCSNI
jgi:hypothetical protein